MLIFRFAVFFIAVSVVASAQQTQARRTQDPESVLFQAFFRQVVQTEDVAAAQRAQGKPDGAARDYLKRRAGLNAAEDSAVKEIARSCTAEYKSATQRGMGIVQELRRQYPDPAAVPDSVADQINQLEDARTQVTARCVESLRQALGSRFQQLDAFVRQTVGPRIRRTDSAVKP